MSWIFFLFFFWNILFWENVYEPCNDSYMHVHVFFLSLSEGEDDPNETHDDEQNDAEFDFLGEADGEGGDSDDEEYVFDRRTKIPRKCVIVT